MILFENALSIGVSDFAKSPNPNYLIFFPDNRIHIISSLPFYNKEKTDNQRGKGVFDKSILALKKLNNVSHNTNGAVSGRERINRLKNINNVYNKYNCANKNCIVNNKVNVPMLNMGTFICSPKHGKKNVKNNDVENDNISSAIQKPSNWCFIGEDQGVRKCVKIGDNACMSQLVYSSENSCINNIS